MKSLLIAGLITMASVTASLADYIDVNSSGTVSETTDRLEAAVTNAGAKVFARVPHSKGAASVDMTLQDAELLIFGNPKLGTPALQQDIRAGLVLPLRVLVHDVDGQTVMTYETVDAMFDGMDIESDAKFRTMIAGALEKLTGAAAK